MSNPSKAPKEPTSLQLSLAVAPDAYLPENFRDKAKSLKNVQAAQRLLEELDMDLAPAVVIPKDQTVAESVKNRKGQAFALAKVGVPEARIRSKFGKAAANLMYGELPLEGLFSQHVVGEAMKKKVYVDAGAEGCLGRLALAYPKRDEVPTWRAVTRTEADAAVRRCGLEMAGLPPAALRPYPLTPMPDEKGVTVNPHADNGFPVLGKWNTPGAAALAMELARTVRDEIDNEGNGETWLRTAELARPWLVAVRGKAKADYYPQEKVVEARMRFYNAFPRQTMLVMQQATQVMELNARHYLNSESYSGIGVSLVHGGAADLVREMDRRMERDGFAYVHVGDDSWVVVRRRGRVAMFALDCSNFDLTQRAEVTREVHASIKRQLRLIDARASELWHGYARQRLVVVTGSLVRVFKHAGPSGMPLQSKINDVLMDVMLNRMLGDLQSLDEDEVARAVEAAGQSMGFNVRLEIGRAHV